MKYQALFSKKGRKKEGNRKKERRKGADRKKERKKERERNISKYHTSSVDFCWEHLEGLIFGGSILKDCYL